MQCWVKQGTSLMLVMLFLSACGEDSMQAAPPTEMTQDICMSPESPTWENFGQGFTRNFCRGCHSSMLAPDQRRGAPEGVDFETHQEVLEQIARVEARAAGEAPTMPPGGGATAEDLKLLQQWLDCGAP